MEQLSQQQRRRDLINSLLKFKDAKEIDKNYIQNTTLEAQIKQFDCQQILNYPNIKLYENILCKYNPCKKAQFLCRSKYCDKHAIMCGEQTCKCALDHRKCTFILIESFILQIASKTQQRIPKQIELYFQVKSVIYQHMANRISQERQALIDWQQGNHNDSALFLYGFNFDQAIVCHAPKVTYQKIHSNHKRWGVPLQIRKKNIREDKKQIINAICKNTHKKYSSMIEYFEQKLNQLQYHKKCANLNPAEFIFIDFLKNMNILIENSEHKELNSDKGLKEIKILAGHIIFFAMKYNKKKFRNLDLENFSINRIIRIWKEHSEKIFRSFVEGKAINELFCQMNKSGFLKAHSVEDLRFQIDKTVQSISQGQEYLFSKSIFTKKLVLLNLQEKQLCTKFKGYKPKKVSEAQIRDKGDTLARYRGDKFDQVCISNDRFPTALNDIETIKELSNLRNVTKLEIKWCTKMKAQVSMEILMTMPYLKELALLEHHQKFSQNFMIKLCQFKQLTLFYINSSSHPQYYRNFRQDQQFMNLYYRIKDNLRSNKELVELSKLPKLQNIEISLVNDANGAQVIKSIKSLRHLKLGQAQSWDSQKQVDAGLIKQLCEQKALITLSIIGLELKIKQLNHIITNNPHLKTIIIKNVYDNENMNDGTVECMANLIQLQNLHIQNNRAITGKHLSKLDKLIMLEIYWCQNFSKKEMKEALTKMHKLQHLNIYYNKWFDDEVITSVQFCKQLAYLNIESTSVSSEGLKHLKGLDRLKILICGFLNINGNDLIELTKQTARINRLSIKELGVNDNQLLQISKNCQELTHLDIRRTSITAEALLKIKQLKVVNSFLDENCKKKLREVGMQTY